MKGEGRIVVVDADYDILDMLARALRARGHHVALATDGRAGLKSAVELCADVVIVDREVRIIDVRTFADVLRDNARTSETHLFVMGTTEPGYLPSRTGGAELIVKPFNAEEIAARVDAVLQNRRAPTREQELRGDLSQVSLFDLLQVFGLNRRTGKLLVESEGGAGEIWLDEGAIIDASEGHLGGEKALYRILRARGGQFLFSPETKTERERRISAPVDHLLMEGARRSDERARIILSLPPLVATLAPGDADAPLSGLGASLMALITEGVTLEELLDRVPAHDLEILEALRGLLASGAARVLDAKGKVSFCEPSEAPSVRAAILRQRRAGVEGGARFGVIAPSLAALESLSAAFGAIREFVLPARPPTRAYETRYGSLGALRIGGTDLELFALPSEPELRPLWGITLGGATTVIVLDDSTLAAEVEESLRALDVRTVATDADVGGATGLVEVLREALALPTHTTPR